MQERDYSIPDQPSASPTEIIRQKMGWPLKLLNAVETRLFSPNELHSSPPTIFLKKSGDTKPSDSG